MDCLKSTLGCRVKPRLKINNLATSPGPLAHGAKLAIVKSTSGKTTPPQEGLPQIAREGFTSTVHAGGHPRAEARRNLNPKASRQHLAAPTCYPEIPYQSADRAPARVVPDPPRRPAELPRRLNRILLPRSPRRAPRNALRACFDDASKTVSGHAVAATHRQSSQ